MSNCLDRLRFAVNERHWEYIDALSGGGRPAMPRARKNVQGSPCAGCGEVFVLDANGQCLYCNESKGGGDVMDSALRGAYSNTR